MSSYSSGYHQALCGVGAAFPVEQKVVTARLEEVRPINKEFLFIAQEF